MKITLNGPKGARTGATIEGQGVVTLQPNGDWKTEASTEWYSMPAPHRLVATDASEREYLLAMAHETVVANQDAWADEAP